MPYFKIEGPRELLVVLKEGAGHGIEIGDVEDLDHGDSLNFDLIDLGSILVWVHDNKELLVAAMNLATAALATFKKSGKAVIKIETPSGARVRIDADADIDEEKILKVLRSLPDIQLGIDRKENK